MDIPVNARVECVDGTCGRSTYVIIKPSSETVTHVVVETNTLASERLVPVNMIVETRPDMIRLRCTTAELAEFQAFVALEYLPGTAPYLSYPAAQYMLGPYASAGNAIPPIAHEQVPPGEMAVRRGAEVEATDGRVGKIDEFLVDPGNGQITHLILRQGHLWGRREITVPASDIDRIEAGVVYLKLDKESIGKLPAVPARR